MTLQGWHYENECPACGKNWAEHRPGYSAYRCKTPVPDQPMTAEQLEELLGKFVKALSLAEHDQIDLLQLCEDLRENTPNERLRKIRSVRAARIEERLRETQAALTAYREARK